MELIIALFWASIAGVVLVWSWEGNDSASQVIGALFYGLLATVIFGIGIGAGANMVTGTLQNVDDLQVGTYRVAAQYKHPIDGAVAVFCTADGDNCRNVDLPGRLQPDTNTIFVEKGENGSVVLRQFQSN